MSARVFLVMLYAAASFGITFAVGTFFGVIPEVIVAVILIAGGIPMDTWIGRHIR